MKEIGILLFIPVMTLFCFLAYVILLHLGILNHDDYWTMQLDYFISLNKFLSTSPIFWDNITHLGDALILLPMLSFFIIVRPQIWVSFFTTIPFGTLLSQGCKALAEMPRPASILNESQITTIGSTITSYTSLPSGHTITAFAAMTVILGILIPSLKTRKHYFTFFCALGIASMLGLSRVAVGAHWPIDIVVGSIFGYFAGISGILMTQRFRCWQWLSKPRSKLIMGVIMLFWSITLIYTSLTSSDHVLFVIWVSTLISLGVAAYLITHSFHK